MDTFHAEENSKRRAGRPNAAQAGEVDARLLAAATELFLTLGFDATTCEQVASLAGAGKASLYARYASKDELFIAVVRLLIEQTPPPGETDDLPLNERLRVVSLDVLERALEPQGLALQRMAVATAPRFPELARLVQGIGWDRGVERLARAIGGSDDGLEGARPAAVWLMSLTYAPQQIRALLGDSPALLQAEARARVEEAVRILNRSGWLEDLG